MIESQTAVNRWASVPFAPRRWPFFYGWVMLGGAIIAVWASIPGQTMGVSVYTDFLLEAWAFSRTQVSMAYMAGTLISGLILPFAGSWIDRYGVRRMVAVSSIGLGLSLLILATSDQWVSTRPAPIAIAMPILIATFLAIRFFGQGCLALVSRVIIGLWFNKRRGLVTGISGLFVSLGFNYSPQLLNDIIVVTGWRESLWLQSAVIGIGVSLIGLIFYRNTPEECGLHMDGAAVDPAQDDTDTISEPVRDFTRAQALRTLSFWVFGLGLAGHGLVITSLTFHIADIAREAGIDRDTAFTVFLPMAFFAIPTNFAASWISDYIKLKWLACLLALGQIVGTIGLCYLHTTWGWWTLIAGYGVVSGLFGTLVTVTWPRFFGRRHLGAISGSNMFAMVWASAIGPVAFSLVYDWTGSYRPVMFAFLAWPALVFLFGLKADNPQERLSADDGIGSG